MKNEYSDHTTLYEQVLLAHLKEQRAKRRWSIFFKVLGWLFVIFLTLSVWNGPKKMEKGEALPTNKHVALVKIHGDILASETTPLLRNAFKNEHSVGIILSIDSPGGSPVEASEIYEELQRLQTLHPEKKVVSVIRNVGASAAYYVAMGAPQIYANPSSIVGSIGAIMATYNFKGLADKVGVDSVSITSGKYKNILDPLKPVNPDEVALMQRTVNEIAKDFQDKVRLARGDRLNKNEPNLFSGLFWSGMAAKNLGLIDDFGSVATVSKSVFNMDIDDIEVYEERLTWENWQKYFTDMKMLLSAKLHQWFGMRSVSPSLS